MRVVYFKCVVANPDLEGAKDPPLY